MRMIRFLVVFSTLWVGTAGAVAPQGPSPTATQPVTQILESQIVVTRVDARFIDVYEALRSAIDGRSLSISHIVPAARVLAASEQQYGNGKAVYRNAKRIEFCSARLSHRLVQVNPQWLVLCPFAVSVYELNQQPGIVVISYRNPEAIQTAYSPELHAAANLYEQIIHDATLWFPPVKPDSSAQAPRHLD